MTYTLGLDLGTTASAVALNIDGAVSMFSIGHRDLVVPSVVYMGTDEDAEAGSTGELVLVGEAAERRATSNPAGIAREFKRRFGDPQPLILNGSPVAANDLTLRLALHLVDQVTEQRGEAPSQLVVCHPANWGDYKLSLLSDTLKNSSLPPHQLISEPVAAAIHDASQETITSDSIVAVYDLGGGTFDVAILRKLDDGWEAVGNAGGIERLGGIDFDTAVLHHVVGALNLDLTSFEADDLTAQTAMFRLRDECKAAKHALSEDTSTSIPVLLPGVNETVRMTRSEFETLIGPAISRTLEIMDATIAASPVELSDIDRILLVGGSSQIPVVRQRVMNHTQRPVALDRHPKHAIALGAAASINVSTVATTIAPEPDVFAAAAPKVEAPPSNETPPEPEATKSLPSTNPVKEMYELPHIPEAPLPDFLNRGDAGAPASTPPLPNTPPTPKAPAAIPPTPKAPAATTRPPTPRSPTPQSPTPPSPAHAPPMPKAPAPAAKADPPPRLVAPPAAQPTIIEPRGSQQLAASPVHPPEAVPTSVTHDDVRRGGGAGFWFVVVLLAALAGGATYYFLRDAPTEVASDGDAIGGDSTTDDGDVIENDPDAVTTTATVADGADDNPAVTEAFETSCSADQLPDPTVRYRVSEPADGFLNGRNVPGTGTIGGVESTPVVTFLVLTELDLTFTDCEVDTRGRAWWGVNSPSGMVWSSTRFIEPIPE